jgi:hypothetical protein
MKELERKLAYAIEEETRVFRKLENPFIRKEKKTL